MAPPRVAVAASAGRDSTALLHCTLRQARPLGIQVLALHVHHGLMPQADAWLQQVRRQSRRWGANFEVRHLQQGPTRGESVEAWARRERYRALAEMALAAGCSLVLLAHHRRDQAETWLLQALRGAGPTGLSAMPEVALRQGLHWARPWLDLPRPAIDAYVQRHRLRFSDDASNADPRYARNRLRLQLWPALSQAFPDAEATLAAAAGHAQQAAALAEEVAAADLPPLLHDGALQIAPWLHLPPARRRNALRAWLAGGLPAGLPETLLVRLLEELPGARSGRWPAPGAQLQLHRGLLSLGTAARRTAGRSLRLDLSQPGEMALPDWGGRFIVEAAVSQGAAPGLLRALQTCVRQGGERFRLSPLAAARSLKKQFQARGVPAWQRDGPLLCSDDGRLVFVPGLGIEGASQAAPGQPQLLIRWVPDAMAPPAGRRLRPD